MAVAIQNEDDLRGYLMKKYKLYYGFPYPKVTRIGGRVISPEIDLLVISYDNKEVSGYEFKLLKYKANTFNYRRIYEGIGQAIHYFGFGVDNSYLVLGVSKSIPEIVRAALYFEIGEAKKIIGRLQALYGFNCLGMKVWDEDDGSLTTTIKAEGKFPTDSFKDCELNKRNLIDLRLAYSVKFLDKYQISHG